MPCVGVMIICSGMTVKNVGLLAANVRKMKAQTKMDTTNKDGGVTLITNMFFCINCVKSTVKYFFLADFFLGAYFDLDKFPFLLAVCFVRRLSCIQVIAVYKKLYAQ